MTGIHDRRKRRDAARDERQRREQPVKEGDALRARLEETEVLARTLSRKHGLELNRARWLVARARPLPALLRKRGQPPANHELFLAVETIRERGEGWLPVGRRRPDGRRLTFWREFTVQWNAVNFEHPERQFITMDGEPDWRGLRAAYQMARCRLEPIVEALAESYKGSTLRNEATATRRG
jgi:hypothetical protein